jgi:formylglycine-generating enzyme required for sulfatase activity/alpha-tubulin suppressor-like RCC1 family protein
VNGTGLTGPVFLTAPEGFEISTNNSTFSREVTLGNPGGRIQSVYRGDFNKATGKIWEAGSGQEFPNTGTFAAITTNGSVVTWGRDLYFWGNQTNVLQSLSSNITSLYSNSQAFAAIKKNGSVVTWGYDLYGGESSYVSAALSSNVTKIASTIGAFAALKNDGSVVTWGTGGGGDSSSSAPALNANVVQIYSTGYAFAALKRDGSVVTWGSEHYGGDSSGVAGSLLSNVTEIYSNGGAFAALKNDGSVVTWGWDSYGGNSSMVSGSLTSNVAQIYSNYDSFAALKNGGSVVTWGSDSNGGNSTSVAHNLASGVIEIFPNGDHDGGAFAALKADGSVVTWGADWAGGDTTSVAGALGANVTAIYSARGAYAALKNDGSVVTWGSASAADSTAVAESLSSNVTAIFSTKYAFAAVKNNGSVVTWGHDFSGGDSSGVSESLSSNVTAIYSTESAFAALKKDGSVVTWGYANYGGTGGPANIGAAQPPTLPQTIFVRLAASNQSGSVSGNITIASDGTETRFVAVSGAVNPSSVPVITSNGTAGGTVGSPFVYQIAATNPPILSYRFTGTPPTGVSFNGTTGVLSGTPTAAGNFTVNLFARNSAGNSTARRLDIAIAPAPPPQNLDINTQGGVPFEAYNTFPAPVLEVSFSNPSNSAMRFQWFFNGAPIRGATQSTYNMGAASEAKQGLYSVLVTNASNQSFSSRNMAFRLIPSAIFSVSGPVNQSFASASPATFSVADLVLPPGNATATYQWFRNGVALTGATGPSYSIPGGVTPSTVGAYSVQVTTRIGSNLIGIVTSRSWSVSLQDSGILVYNMSGSAARTVGANETTGTITGYFIMDRANDNAAIIQTHGTGFARMNSLEMRPDIASASTGPVVGSRTVFAGSLNGGDNPMDHDMAWITGRDAALTVAPATSAPTNLPAVRVFAPSTMNGTLGTLVRNANSVEIDSFAVTLTINNPLTTLAYRNGFNLEQAVRATRDAANAAGFIDDPSTPSPATNMVLVQGGTLPPGSDLAGQIVSTFRIGKFEVTWSEWQEVRAWAVQNGYSDLANVGAGSGANHPAQNMSWYDAVKWCNAKSQREGLMPVYNFSGLVYKNGQANPSINPISDGYRLLTEAEWEWAARGGASSQGKIYSGADELNSVGWFLDNSLGASVSLQGGRGTWPVGQKAANELGTHDMSGNVWEWCWDSIVFGPNDSARLIRGGAWNTAVKYCTVSYRQSDYGSNSKANYLGFRLARSAGE